MKTNLYTSDPSIRHNLALWLLDWRRAEAPAARHPMFLLGGRSFAQRMSGCRAKNISTLREEIRARDLVIAELREQLQSAREQLAESAYSPSELADLLDRQAESEYSHNDEAHND